MPDRAPNDDAAALMRRVGGWLSQQMPGSPPIEIRDVMEPSQGFSSRTILFTAVSKSEDQWRERQLVARLQRTVVVPMLSDVFHQYRVMRAVAANSDVKVPNIDFAEESGKVLGTPFFLMDRIDGRVPPDFPSYHAEGWFAETLTDSERASAWWNGVAEMEKLHRIDWRAFPFLAPGLDQTPSAPFYLQNFVARWFEWAAQGQAFPVIEEALRFLIANPPPLQRAGLVWNDARLGNTMFAHDGSDVMSLLDFEVASLGPAEIDLAHWVYLDDIFSTNFGIERISGIPDEDAAVKGFERLYGWPMPYFSYYLAVAALKILILSVRDYSNGKTMDTPDALPGFLVERLRRYLARYADYLTAGGGASSSSTT
jgi:aminoglycoside phosphotransferase (APT) family kinase protein